MCDENMLESPPLVEDWALDLAMQLLLHSCTLQEAQSGFWTGREAMLRHSGLGIPQFSVPLFYKVWRSFPDFWVMKHAKAVGPRMPACS